MQYIRNIGTALINLKVKAMENKKLRESQSAMISALYRNVDTVENKKIQKAKQLAARIETALKQKGINKSSFANIMGVQPSVITKWLSGTHNFTIDTLFDIEHYLDIDLFAFNLHPLDTTIKLFATVHSNEPGNIHTGELPFDILRPDYHAINIRPVHYSSQSSKFHQKSNFKRVEEELLNEY